MYKMPSKKKKYNARFPAGRIKKIMQTDEEVGKVAQAVPVMVSRTLELFVESLLIKSTQITISRNAKTLTPSHMKQCILAESRFDFLKDLVKNIPDASAQEDNDNNFLFDSAIENQETSNTTNAYEKQACSHRNEKKSGTVIRYGPHMSQDSSCPTSSSSATKRTHLSRENLRNSNSSFGEHLSNILSVDDTDSDEEISDDDERSPKIPRIAIEDVPPLVPISSQSRNDVLVIDEDYDN